MAKLAMDDPFFVAKALKWYKRREVQEAILAECEQREVSPRFGEGFGKRPDALFYPGDILDLATKRATSFHCSEERWRDPLQLVTGSPRKALDDLRVGWDLVLDIDCPYWLYSKLTAKLFVTALEDHGVSCSVKFSGSKGFHIGVAFEAFPEEVEGRPTSSLFPEGPRALAQYLLGYISDELIKVHKNEVIVFDKRFKVSFEKLKEHTGKEASAFIQHVCRKCRAPKREGREEPARRLYLCTSCGHTHRQEGLDDFLQCERCNGVMELQQTQKNGGCEACGHDEFEPRFNVLALIEVDTVLLASRHLFRRRRLRAPHFRGIARAPGHRADVPAHAV